jgi:hypothetical protein
MDKDTERHPPLTGRRLEEYRAFRTRKDNFIKQYRLGHITAFQLMDYVISAMTIHPWADKGTEHVELMLYLQCL